MQNKIILPLIILLVGVMTSLIVTAVGEEQLGDCPMRINNEATSEAINQLFQRVNNLRTSSEIAPYRLNTDLCVIASQHASDIGTRQNTGLPLSTRSDGSTVADWLNSVGWPSYPAGTNIQPGRVRVYASQAYGPEDIIQFLDANEQESENIAFARDRRYRELGIGYVYNTDSQTHFYVWIYASRPNILPITVVRPGQPNIPAETTNSSKVEIWLNNEVLLPQGFQDQTIGQVSTVKVSIREEAIECPQSPTDPNWTIFGSRIEYTIPGGVGPHTLHVQFCDSIGRTTTAKYDVFVSADGFATADFSASVTIGEAPLTVNFTNNSINAVNYEWDFNADGNVDQFVEAPTHVFQTAGIYPVELTAYADNGTSDTVSIPITVTEPQATQVPLDPRINIQQDEINPLEYTFSAEGSTGNIQQYLWNFGDSGETDKTGLVVSHVFPSPDGYPVDYTVQLTLRGDRGTAESTTATVTIEQPPDPVIADFIFNPLTATAPATIQFNSTSTGRIASYQWDFTGDTAYERSEPSVEWFFEQAGDYVVTLTITGENGTRDSTQKTITINAPDPTSVPPTLPPEPTATTPPPPTARIIADTTQGTVPLRVNFTAEQSSGEINRFEWEANGDNAPDGVEEIFQYTYETPGTYIVVLKVRGPGGESIDTQQIQVRTLPSPTVPLPSASFEASAMQGTAPLEVRFTSSDNPETTQYLWDFNDDGLTDTTDPNPTHIFQSDGIYEVKLSVSNRGGSQSDTKTINVTGPTATPTNTPTLPPTPTLVATNTLPPRVTLEPTFTPSPTPTIPTPIPTQIPVSDEPAPLEIGLSFATTETWIAITNRSSMIMSPDQVHSLRFRSQSGIIFPGGNTWYANLDSEYSLSPRECVVIWTSFTDAEVDLRDVLTETECIDIAWHFTYHPGGEVETNKPPTFWQDTPFEVLYGNHVLLRCDSSSCIYDATRPLPPQTDSNTSDSSSDYTSDIQFYWTADYFILHNISTTQIPAGQILNIELARNGSSLYPTQNRTWNSEYAFRQIRSNECIVLVASDRATQVSYSEGMRTIGCLDEVTWTTAPAFWVNGNFIVIYNRQEIAQCNRSANQCIFELPR